MRAEPGADQLAEQHAEAGLPDHLSGGQKDQQGGEVGGAVQGLGGGRGLDQGLPAAQDPGQRIQRTRARAEHAVIKPDGGRQRVFIRPCRETGRAPARRGRRRDQKVERNASQHHGDQHGQGRAVDKLHGHAAERRPHKGREHERPYPNRRHLALLDHHQGRRGRADRALELVGAQCRERRRPGQDQGWQRQQSAAARQRIQKTRRDRDQK